MTETYYQLRVVNEKTLRIDGERTDFKKGQKISADLDKARYLVNTAEVAKYAGKKHEVEDANQSVIVGDTVETKDDETSVEKDFDFEEYVKDHNADTVIEDVESSDTVAWLENLRNYDERKTVQDAIDERIDELE